MGRAGANLWFFPIFLPIFTFQPGKNHRDGSRARFALPVPPFYWRRSFGRVEGWDALKNWKTTPQLSRGEGGHSRKAAEFPGEVNSSTSQARLPPGFSSPGDFPALIQHLEGFEELLSKRIPRPERHKINITSARAGAAHLHIPGLIIARQLRCFDNNQGLNMLNMLNSLNICPPVARNRRAGLQIFAPRLFDISEKVKNGRTNGGISEPFNNLDFIEYSPSPLRHFSLAN